MTMAAKSPSLDLLPGDVLARLRELPDESVQCCVTSPPYWGLRDYKAAGQIGLEKSHDAYVQKIVEVFREVRRVLRKDGTLWLNLGDSYAASGKGGNPESSPHKKQLRNRGSVDKSKRIPRGSGRWGGGSNAVPGLKPKDLCGIPWRVALALQADGWYLRSDIIWSKSNPMPESVLDRPTRAHEYIFLLSKSERYYYNAAAIAEPCVQNEDANGFRGGSYVGNEAFDNTEGSRRKTRGNINRSQRHNYKIPAGWDTAPCGHGSFHREGRGKPEKQRGHSRRHDGFNDRWDAMGKAEQCSGMRNKRSVWTIATQPYPEAHFATFPEELPKLCILAGTKPGDVVLDPFGGSGTTGKVALELGRSAILIELNREYCEMARRRCHITPGFVFQEVAA